MLLRRDEFVSAFFCETDRAQRLKMSLALIAVGFVECDTWRSGPEQSGWDGPECVLVGRITRILRCYDSVGKWNDEEFFLLLPGCTVVQASTLAERLRDEVFAEPVEAGGRNSPVRVCFGVASSGGRSPFVVLREAQRTLQEARDVGPGSIRRLAADTKADSTAFLIPVLPPEGHPW
jgi:two-component system cell cycle response regulator